jgi:metal-dependent HD superfamily phosphatase/phosphodiesterase
MSGRDAEVIVATGAMLHDVGMSIHRVDHEAYSLFLAADKLHQLLEGIYDKPERSVIAAEVQHAIIGHRRHGTPLTIEAGVVRVADALDMAAGRSRVPFEAGQKNIHALSAAAIDGVTISAGEAKPVRVEIAMNNSAGIFQIDELLGNKLKGSGIEQYVEVAARVDREHEARLLPDMTF